MSNGVADERLSGLGRSADPLGDVNRNGRLAHVYPHASRGAFVDVNEPRRRADSIRGRPEGGNDMIAR